MRDENVSGYSEGGNIPVRMYTEICNVGHLDWSCCAMVGRG